MLLRLPPILLVALLGLALGILRFLILLPFRRRIPPFAELRLEGVLQWREPRARPFRDRLGRRPTSVEGVEGLLDALAREPKIRGVVVTVRQLQGSLPRMEAVAASLQRFRGRGKEVVLYWKEATSADFTLVPAADRVLLAPGGTVLLLGYAATVTGLRSALDRLGILPDFLRIGPYKTAPELFTEEEPSEIQRKFVESALDARYRRLVRAVAARRRGDEGWARSVIDRGPFTSARAVDAGLVDALVFPDELADFLSAGADASSDARILPAETVAASRRWTFRPPVVRPRPRIVVVPISGIIKQGKSLHLPSGPSFAGEETVVGQLERLRRDRSVGGVVVYADSRGGAAPASELIWRAVRRCAEAKPTAAYVERVAASGGYFAIAGARRIFAAPGSWVGSIGVFTGRFDLQRLLRRLGIHQEAILRGAHAGLLAPFRALDPREREAMEAEIAQVYDDFVGRVSEGRARSKEEILALGEGRVFLAEDAPEALVDQVADLPAAIGWTAKEAGVDPARARVEVLRARTSRLGRLPALVGGLLPEGEMSSLVQTILGMDTVGHWLVAPPLPEEGFGMRPAALTAIRDAIFEERR